jgi:hypothetical protein
MATMVFAADLWIYIGLLASADHRKLYQTVSLDSKTLREESIIH